MASAWFEAREVRCASVARWVFLKYPVECAPSGQSGMRVGQARFSPVEEEEDISTMSS